MKQRLFALLLSILGGLLLIVSLQISAPFSHDPLGPKPFPVTVSVGLLLLPLWILLFSKPSGADYAFDKRVMRLIAVLFFYFATFELLGFMLATTLSCYFIARIIGSSRMQGLLTGLMISIVFYGVFRLLLDANLPLGRIYNIFG